MPRPRKAPRLAWRNGSGSEPGQWVIRDGTSYIRTGCTRQDTEAAETRLADYIADKHRPSNSKDPSAVPAADALTFYARHHIPTLANPKNEALILAPLAPFFGQLTLRDINRASSKEYATARFAQGVSPGTVRRELAALRSAVNMFVADREIPFICRIELPPPGEARLRWLTRGEAARMIHAARRRGNHHLARMILIAVYTGTRSHAITSLRWVPSIDSGYIDLQQGVLYRKGMAERSTSKRRPSIRIPARLRPHLERWRRLDSICTHVIHRDGKPLKSIRRAWRNTRDQAGLDSDVIPHSLRHTAASWGIQNVTTTQDLQSLADFLGMSLKMLLEVYGHLNPAHQQSASDAIARRPGA